jgi:hypothetical protein
MPHFYKIDIYVPGLFCFEATNMGSYTKTLLQRTYIIASSTIENAVERADSLLGNLIAEGKLLGEIGGPEKSDRVVSRCTPGMLKHLGFSEEEIKEFS